MNFKLLSGLWNICVIINDLSCSLQHCILQGFLYWVRRDRGSLATLEKNLLNPPIWKNFPPVDPIPSFLHPTLNNNFHTITQQKLHFHLCSSFLYHFYFNFILLALIQPFISHRWPILGARKSAPKKSKNNFFQDKFYSLMAHAHYFTVLIYLANCRAAKIGIFTHFTSTNLPQCSQSINSLIYVNSVQIHGCSLWVLDQSRITLLCTTVTQKSFLHYPQYSLYTQVKLILISINVQFLQNVVFNFEKGPNGQNHSFSGSHHLIK